MRTSLRNPMRTHRGKVLVFTAMLLPVIMAFMTLAVEVSVIATSRVQLNTVSDAAALAGAMQLADEQRVRRTTTDVTPEITSAQAVAKAIAQDNRVLTAVPVVLNNSRNSSTGDIVAGYVNPTTHQWSDPSLSDPLKTNSVKVTASRSMTHGGLVPGIFSRTWGFTGSTVVVTSTATCWNTPIQGFTPAGSTPANSPNASLLPIVLYKENWIQMMAGNTPDQYAFDPDAYDPSTGDTGVSSASDGITESQLYPVANGDPGNWGTINMGVSQNDTSTVNSQILYGITPAQLATYPNSKIELDNSLNPPSITFSGNAGISAGLKSSLDAIIGKPVTIPIYDQTSGNGSNSTYRVIAFQPCRIMAVNFQTNNNYVIIQPCLIKDPTGIPMSATSWPATWSWNQGGLVRVHLTH